MRTRASSSAREWSRSRGGKDRKASSPLWCLFLLPFIMRPRLLYGLLNAFDNEKLSWCLMAFPLARFPLLLLPFPVKCIPRNRRRASVDKRAKKSKGLLPYRLQKWPSAGCFLLLLLGLLLVFLPLLPLPWKTQRLSMKWTMRRKRMPIGILSWRAPPPRPSRMGFILYTVVKVGIEGKRKRNGKPCGQHYNEVDGSSYKMRISLASVVRRL